ncbi:MAG: NAD(P)/FAD-dependent oxidoreductase [Lachnospiraceae bacterium]|nr:NAD(P)/FAD-dependent oxidoreductase [Lachnospiraceae bacterium]
MIRINQLKLPVGHNNEELRRKIAKKLKFSADVFFIYEIVKRSIDARKKPKIFYSYVIDVTLDVDRSGQQNAGNNTKAKAINNKHEEKIINRLNDPQVVIYNPTKYNFPFRINPHQIPETARPIIIGAGPAGLFCAYMLAKAGFRPLLIERGEAVEEREITVASFWKTGLLNPESNVQFGEGGAGTFSDGKLNTQIKDKDGLRKEVLKIFVALGAPEKILFEQKPHLGTDILKNIVVEMRKAIIRCGGEVRFGQKLEKLIINEDSACGKRISGILLDDGKEIKTNYLILAIGHSARDTFAMLNEFNIPMEAKPFAVGMRVSHPQRLINQAKYGVSVHEFLESADYKLVSNQKERAVFSFCMCPGGYIVNASSEADHLVVNGMSYSNRAESRANSAIVLAVGTEEFGSLHPLAGIAYQRRLEEKAYKIGKGKIPISYYGDFKNAVTNAKEASKGDKDSFLKAPCIKGEWCFAPLSEILPTDLKITFIKAMNEFGRRIPGFDDDNTIIAGVESRTSSPVRILRDAGYQSACQGLFPCGEGAGYAGGIMSAAMDGIRVACAAAKEIIK